MKKKKQKFEINLGTKIKKFQLDKIVIFDFQAKKVKGGGGQHPRTVFGCNNSYWC